MGQGAFFQTVELWPTRVGFYWSASLAGACGDLFAESERKASLVSGGRARTSGERRVRHILDGYEIGVAVREELRAAARQFVGEPWGEMLDPDYCENRTLIIEPGGFISTHKDSREGDLTAVMFLTGGGDGEPINSVGNPRFVVEDPSRYFDEARLPYEERHGFSVNPRPGLVCFFPSHIPHNQHPYTGQGTHMQVVANFRLNVPTETEEELFD
jgi:hypothetical protein